MRRSKSSISANRKVVSVCFLDGTSVKIETEVCVRVYILPLPDLCVRSVSGLFIPETEKRTMLLSAVIGSVS